MPRLFPLVPSLLIATLVSPAAHADPKLIEYGKHLAGECTTCHRLDGTSNGIPSIVGWEPAVFAAALNSFKMGERNNPAMVSVAGSLDDTQVAALALYFSSVAKAGDKAAKRK